MPKRIDPSGLTGGLHAVEALIRNEPRRVRSLILMRGAGHPKLHQLQREAEAAGIKIQQLPKAQLDAWFPGPHQGALAFCESRPLQDWAEVHDKLLAAKHGGRAPIIVVPAAMEDPRNLGACIRTAAGLGVDAMLLPGKGVTGLTPAAAKTAAGTENVFPICRARDIEKDLKELAALLEREATGRGQRVDTSLLHALMNYDTIGIQRSQLGQLFADLNAFQQKGAAAGFAEFQQSRNGRLQVWEEIPDEWNDIAPHRKGTGLFQRHNHAEISAKIGVLIIV